MNKTKNGSAVARPPSVPKRSHGMQGGTLGVALPRYYQLEIRALEGLVAALEPRPKVRQPSPESRIAQLEKSLSESRRECARQQALVRAAERGLGIKPTAVTEGKPLGKDKSGRRKRRPTVRALKAAKVLAQESRPHAENSLQCEEQTDRVAEFMPPGADMPPAGPSTLSQGTVG